MGPLLHQRRIPEIEPVPSTARFGWVAAFEAGRGRHRQRRPGPGPRPLGDVDGTLRCDLADGLAGRLAQGCMEGAAGGCMEGSQGIDRIDVMRYIDLLFKRITSPMYPNHPCIVKYAQ